MAYMNKKRTADTDICYVWGLTLYIASTITGGHSEYLVGPMVCIKPYIFNHFY